MQWAERHRLHLRRRLALSESTYLSIAGATARLAFDARAAWLAAVGLPGPPLTEVAAAAGLPAEGAPAAWDGWTAAGVRAVAAELAARRGRSAADLLARAASVWGRAEAAGRKARRAERDRAASEAEQLEARLADLRAVAAGPAPAEWRHRTAVETAARRALDGYLRPPKRSTS